MMRIKWRHIPGAILFTILVVGMVNLLGNVLIPSPQETGKAKIDPAASPAASKDADAAKPTASEAPAGEAPASADSEAAEIPETLLSLLRGGDANAGRHVARKCAACHNFGPDGPRRVGPSLWNIVGAPMARVEGYPYSRALRQVGGEWSLTELDSFLANPREALPGTRMKFAGLRNARERADILLFLRSLSDSPAPLPEPS